MKRQVPLTIVLVLGIFFIIQYFIPSRASQTIYDNALIWSLIMGIPALAIAVDSLVRHHVIKIQRKKAGYLNSYIYLASALLMAVIGIFGGVQEGGLFMRLFTYVLAPMEATVFSLLAFYITTAAYRAFRARTTEATLLLVSAFILMLGLIPLGASIWRGIPALSEWMMMVPNMASKRAIMFGVGIGMAATSLKIILGIERNWLGR
jgi:hypothetical protein